MARNAATTVKRVHQELGGKSPNILLPDLDSEGLQKAIAAGVMGVMINSGQSCNAPTRMLVPNARMAEVLAIAKAIVKTITVGAPDSGATICPVVSKAQWEKIQELIQRGIDEGAPVVVGGLGKPEDLEKGWFVRPTVLGPVPNTATIAREEIFGPVLVVVGYDTVEEAVRIANDTPYGLAAYVSGADMALTHSVAAQLRAGQVNINSAPRTSWRRLAATSSRAMAANGASTPSASSSRSRRCWATNRKAPNRPLSRPRPGHDAPVTAPSARGWTHSTRTPGLHRCTRAHARAIPEETKR